MLGKDPYILLQTLQVEQPYQHHAILASRSRSIIHVNNTHAITKQVNLSVFIPSDPS